MIGNTCGMIAGVIANYHQISLSVGLLVEIYTGLAILSPLLDRIQQNDDIFAFVPLCF